MRKTVAILTTITLSVGLIAFPSVSKGKINDFQRNINSSISMKEFIHDNAPYEEVITLNNEDIQNLDSKAKNSNTQKSINLQTYKEGSMKYINKDDLEIDLENPGVIEAMEAAEKAGNKWGLGSLTITTTFKKDNGEFLTNEEYEQIIKEREEYGKEKSFNIIENTDEGGISTAALPIGDSGSTVYSYLTSYATVYNEDSGAQRRHYVYGRHLWSGTWSWGAVNTHNYDSKEDLLVGAWSIGPISSSATRDVSVRYENLSGNSVYYGKSNLTQVVDPNSPGNMSAWKVKERLSGDYAIKDAQIQNYTGWYDRAKVAADGVFRTVYAHGFKEDTLSLTIGVSYPAGVSIGITPSSVSRVEQAVSYALMKRN